MAEGVVANAVKQGMKAYVVVSDRVRTGVETLTEGWSDLVAEANAEREPREQPEEAAAAEPQEASGARTSRTTSKPYGDGSAGAPQA